MYTNWWKWQHEGLNRTQDMNEWPRRGVKRWDNKYWRLDHSWRQLTIEWLYINVSEPLRRAVSSAPSSVETDALRRMRSILYYINPRAWPPYGVFREWPVGPTHLAGLNEQRGPTVMYQVTVMWAIRRGIPHTSDRLLLGFVLHIRTFEIRIKSF